MSLKERKSSDRNVKHRPSVLLLQITKTILILNELTSVSVEAFSKEQSLPVNIKPSSSVVLTASSCDYKSYPSSGCSDSLTTCDVATSKCICNPLTSIKVGHKCLTYRNINEPCSTSKQCDKIEGKCMNTFGEVDPNMGIINHGSVNHGLVNHGSVNHGSVNHGSVNHGSVNHGLVTSKPTERMTESSFSDTSDGGSTVFNPVFLLNLHTGFCQCSDGMYYNQDKKKCIKRLIGSNCTLDSSCFNKEHVYCDVRDKVCSCEPGFSLDILDDNCKTHYNLLSHVLSQLPPFDGHGRNHPSFPHVSSTNGNDRTIILPNYNHLGDNRSWSSLVWKVAILCIVLIILMGFVSGIQKARQNENLINWSRAMEQYSESRGRNVSTDQSATDSVGNQIAHRILMTHAYPTITEMRVMMPPPQYTSRQDIDAIERDDPPSYEEAIRMGPTNDTPNETIRTTQTTPLNSEITESTIK